MRRVQITITHCKECQHFRCSRYYTADSWEYVEGLYCEHPNFKGLRQAKSDLEEWDSPPGIGICDLGDKHPEIPEWCPLIGEQK